MQTIEQFRQELAMLAGNPAQQLAAQGRGGDSMLVHMRPDEVAAMQQMAQQAGTSMSVNPSTGLPEAFKLRDLFNINTYTDPIERGMKSAGLGGLYSGVSNIAQKAGQVAPYVIPFIPGGALASVGLEGLASPMGRGIVGGLAGAFGGGGRPNIQRGLMAGLTSYGLSSAYQGLQAAGGAPPPPGQSFDAFGTPVEAGSPAAMSADVVGTTPGMATRPMTAEFDAATQGVKNLMSGDKATTEAAKAAFGKEFGMGKAYATVMGATGLMSIEEQERQLEASRAAGQIAEAEYQARRARIDAAKRRAEEAMRANPYQFAIGGDVDDSENNPYGMSMGGNVMGQGIVPGGKSEQDKNVLGLAKGGQPRYIDGPGDGMSDSVPATIGGRQPARLADGEFVVPADVVSHLGNGSTKAGAKQLYAMMDRVRQARTGNKQQGKEINPSKYLPT